MSIFCFEYLCIGARHSEHEKLAHGRSNCTHEEVLVDLFFYLCRVDFFFFLLEMTIFIRILGTTSRLAAINRFDRTRSRALARARASTNEIRLFALLSGSTPSPLSILPTERRLDVRGTRLAGAVLRDVDRYKPADRKFSELGARPRMPRSCPRP